MTLIYRTALALVLCVLAATAATDLTKATVVVRPGALPPAERTAATVLIDEMERRSGIRLQTSTQWPASGPVIAITSAASVPAWNRGTLPSNAAKAEGFRLLLDSSKPASPVVWILGADARGTLYGAGHLLRQLDWAKGKLALTASLVDVTTSPAKPIRGHQLGFRATANSWDAWTIPQFDRYIRELALFGMNSVEGIPFGDESKNPLLKVPKREMNRALTQICERYGMDYWTWAPAGFDLHDATRRTKFLDEVSQVAQDAVVLHHIFVPGGDPGDHEPQEMLAFLAEVAARARKYHPQTKVWFSMQGFHEAKSEYVYNWLAQHSPDWIGGLVWGPSSPSLSATRRRMPRGMKLRLYPDITHNKISQFEVPEWDQAYALTLGREAINPRPFEYAAIHARTAPFSDGGLSYSDGVHDDANKILWSALDWTPGRDPREILIEYARLHFSSTHATEIADALLALERNWRGSLAANGSVEATLRWWSDLQTRLPELNGNWRWQMWLLRANYDAYLRRRLLQDAALEQEANAVLLQASSTGAEAAMRSAEEVLNRAVKTPAGADLRARIVELCEQLWQSVGLQTSVEKYKASGAERGAVLDFIDLPLNNRWWLEDEFANTRKLTAESDKVKRLRELAEWENPGPGSYYDDIGNLAKSPHVIRGAGEEHDPLFWWWDQGKSRARHSWQVTQWPEAVMYEGLEPGAKYAVRTTGYGQSLLKMDGGRVQPIVDGKDTAEFKEYPVPAGCLVDGKLVLTWDKPMDEEHLNWRRQSRLAEVWLLKKESR